MAYGIDSFIIRILSLKPLNCRTTNFITTPLLKEGAFQKSLTCLERVSMILKSSEPSGMSWSVSKVTGGDWVEPKSFRTTRRYVYLV